MDKKNAALGVLALVAASAVVHHYWDDISKRLGLAELSPTRIRAIDLAKSAYSLDSYRTNYEVIEHRMRSGITEPVGNGWMAETTGASNYLVSYRFTQDGDPDSYRFAVDIETLQVKLLPSERLGRFGAGGKPGR